MNETKIAFKAVTKTILKTKLTESKSIQSVIHYITAFLAICVAPLVLLTACGNDDPADLDDKITFATSSMYPPFEFHAQGELQGLDIDIAKAVAKELGREAIFEDMQFGAVLAAIQSGQADAGIATMTITDERKQTNSTFGDIFSIFSIIFYSLDFIYLLILQTNLLISLLTLS